MLHPCMCFIMNKCDLDGRANLEVAVLVQHESFLRVPFLQTVVECLEVVSHQEVGTLVGQLDHLTHV